MYLLDTNILIYAFRKDSPQHQSCYSWLTQTLEQGHTLTTPSLNEIAFVRINTLTSLKEKAAPLKDCFQFLSDLQQVPNYKHTIHKKSINKLWQRLCESYELKGNDINDAYLAALALEYKATLVSADEGFKRFKEITWLNPTAKA